MKIVIGAALAACAVPLIHAQVDATALVAQSIQNYERDWREGMSWEYTQTDKTMSEGTEEVDVSAVAPLGGTPYERLLLKDGHGLTPEQQKKESRKYEKAVRQREDETPEERGARIHKYEAERSFIKDIPNAYTFELVGEELVEGRPAWVVKRAPKPGCVPTAPHAAMLGHIKGTLWIDKEDVQWAKAEADVIDTIEIGWIMARIGQGARFTVKQKRVADGLWMPERITIRGVARVMLVHSKVLNEELEFSGYRKAPLGTNALIEPPADVRLPGVNAFR
jgi:hypothetical protein